MALPEHSHRNGGLRLDTGNGHGDGDGSTTKESRPSFTSKQEVPPARALPRGSEASEDTIKLSTRSLEGPNEEALERISSTAPTSDPLVEQYLRDRKPSVSFNNEVKLDTGHRQSMLEPLDKPAKVRPRGRSLLQAISDERSRAARVCNTIQSLASIYHNSPLHRRKITRELEWEAFLCYKALWMS
jgi:hypothetical protein